MLRRTLNITVLIMLFLSSTILIATRTDVSSGNASDQAISVTSTAVIYVSPENNTYDIDETFAIDVIVANVTDLYGVGIRFKWDPTILEYVSHTAKIPVETFSDGILHEPGMKIKDEVNATGGTYQLAYASMPPAPVFNGTGTAFNMTFRVRSLSGCTLDITEADLSDHSGNPLKDGWDIKDGKFKPVGASAQTTISILSPENKTYPVNDVPLTFTVSESTLLIGYSLDGQANVTITGNTTLSGLSDGSHNLTVYIKDTAGNVAASETVCFSMYTQTPEPFPTWIVGATVATIAVAAVATAVFWRRRKQPPIRGAAPHLRENKSCHKRSKHGYDFICKPWANLDLIRGFKEVLELIQPYS